MKVVGIIFFSVAGFLLSTSEGRECYNCADCEGELGTLLDCSSFSTSSSCYLSRIISTGKVSKACGATSLDLLGLPEGCTTQDDVVFCRCTEDRCNVDGLLTSTPSSTTVSPIATTAIAASANATTVSAASARMSAAVTNTTAASIQADAFYCYECVQCGSSLGTLVNCASYTTSRTCYSQKDRSGDVIKTCGNARIDALAIPLGCSQNNGYYTCKCLESGCNDYRDTTTATATTLSATLTRSQDQPSAVPTPASQQGINCYFCRDCGSFVGVLYDCTRAFQSTSCYLLKEPSGEITRTCGTPEADELGIDYGCTSTSDGYILCRCDTDSCNRYPEITSERTTTTATRRTTPSIRTTVQPTESSSSWQCYLCTNCGSSVGSLVECSTFSGSRTCLLIRQSSGEVTRSCGLETIDEFGLADGCGTNAGITICKCSENACNEYPEFRTGASSEVTRPTPAVRRTTPAVRRTTPAATRTTPTISDSEFYCHVCQDCGNSVGQLAACPTSKSCALVIENGKYSRFCGTTAVDIQIPEQRGCINSGNSEICKCSASECNTYYIKTGITANEGAPTTPDFIPTFHSRTTSFAVILESSIWFIFAGFLLNNY